MIHTVLFYLHSSFLIVFGLLLSFSFCDIQWSKQNIITGLVFFLLSGFTQIVIYLCFDEMTVRALYPLITHLPLIILLMKKYHKSFLTSFASVTSAYLCCQPAKWTGILFHNLTLSYTAELVVSILSLLISAVIVIYVFSPFFAELFVKMNKDTIYFVLIPTVYYLFDYTVGSFITMWHPIAQAIIEFLPVLVCIMYLIFGTMYTREHESRLLAEQKEQIIQIASDQQKKEFELMETNLHRITILRHDMRHFLNNLSFLIQNNQNQEALNMISAFTSEVDATTIHRYCSYDTINYVLSYYAARCSELHVQFDVHVQLSEFDYDPLLFSSILSNALDNALNAQKELDEQERFIKIMLKTSHGKLLLSIKNPYVKTPVFVNDIPVSNETGHGYGTQSIRFLTERLKGNYQFALEDDLFVLRIVL